MEGEGWEGKGGGEGHGVRQIIFPFFPNAVGRFTPNTAAFIRLTCRGEGRRRLTLNPPASATKHTRSGGLPVEVVVVVYGRWGRKGRWDE